MSQCHIVSLEECESTERLNRGPLLRRLMSFSHCRMFVIRSATSARSARHAFHDEWHQILLGRQGEAAPDLCFVCLVGVVRRLFLGVRLKAVSAHLFQVDLKDQIGVRRNQFSVSLRSIRQG